MSAPTAHPRRRTPDSALLCGCVSYVNKSNVHAAWSWTVVSWSLWRPCGQETSDTLHIRAHCTVTVVLVDQRPRSNTTSRDILSANREGAEERALCPVKASRLRITARQKAAAACSSGGEGCSPVEGVERNACLFGVSEHAFIGEDHGLALLRCTQTLIELFEVGSRLLRVSVGCWRW